MNPVKRLIVPMVALFVCATMARGGPVIKLPDTKAGACATAFFQAFNSGSDEQMRTFENKFRSKAALERRPVEARIEQYHDLRDNWGDLTVDGVFESRDLELSLGVNASERDDFLIFRFELEDQPPHGLTAVYIEADAPRPQRAVAGSEAGTALTNESRSDAVNRIAKVLKAFYVYPEVGEKMAGLLRGNLKEGVYDTYTDGRALARRLTADLRDICHDRHLRIDAGDFPKEAAARSEPDDSWWARSRTENFGFEKVERLPGNIGYLKFNQFNPSEEAQHVAGAAMNFLANADALIFDLRENGGGSPEMINFLSGYLFNERVHLNSFYDRKEDRTTHSYSRTDVPGKQFGPEKPVYVLTSSYTFSGAEEFTYNLKNLKRATIVGETTGGGAHPVYRHRINDSFMVKLPYARAINPITKTNWEGVGVKPHIDVPAGRALLAAQKNALERIITSGGEMNDDARAALRRVTRELASIEVKDGPEVGDASGPAESARIGKTRSANEKG